jgi:hypothetical protein
MCYKYNVAPRPAASLHVCAAGSRAEQGGMRVYGQRCQETRKGMAVATAGNKWESCRVLLELVRSERTRAS